MVCRLYFFVSNFLILVFMFLLNSVLLGNIMVVWLLFFNILIISCKNKLVVLWVCIFEGKFFLILFFLVLLNGGFVMMILKLVF